MATNALDSIPLADKPIHTDPIGVSGAAISVHLIVVQVSRIEAVYASATRGKK
ncbi:hypothetical protein JJB98_12210 [Bradyrhizobium diazoefficiens]|nr:hypothetical protein [Bradyrhizobium diazoefficiens]QQO20620.1 hypothetical protein JJB98_12210 [Bradyrhizobium diazoefficiens]